MWEWIGGQFSALMEWLGTALQWLLDTAIVMTLDLTAWLFEQIPVPEFLGDVVTEWNAISTGPVGFWLEPWRVGYGLTVVFGALGLRFLMRRLPIIG
jgi:hypothetical protein